MLPAVCPDMPPYCLSSEIAGLRASVVVVDPLAVGAPMPFGGVPVTVAWFVTVPASISAWVIVCDPVQVVLAPGSSVVVGQV